MQEGDRPVNELYRTFVQIVESETLVRAAETLHLTQPTLTRHVQQLEREFGLKLFDRVGKRLVLNHPGEVVYRYAKSLLRLEQKMLAELSAFGDPEVGTVYIGAGLTPSIYLLPPLLAWYHKQHEKVQFQVRSGSSQEIWAALQQREIDFGIVTTIDASWDNYEVQPLMQDDLLLVAAPVHPLYELETATFAEITKFPFVVMQQGSGLRQLILELAASHGTTLHIAMETDSLESLNRLVQSGVGLSFLPRSSVADDLEMGRLVQIKLADVQLGARTITLITHKDGPLSACSSQFLSEAVQFVQPHSSTYS